ncbi:hypothetical protein GGF31_001595 [Allomyces arbusculus]|nr:hypothetical protein GGF31_001595 [Allomyces arbusculus]
MNRATLIPMLISGAVTAAVTSAAWLLATTPALARDDVTSDRDLAAPRRASGDGNDKSNDADNADESGNLLNLLFSIAEDQARKEGYVHRGITCNHCGTSPIRGLRYKCSNCVDFDLCETCEAQEVHQRTHVFLKIRIPIPPLANPRTALLNVFYPGNRSASDTLSWDKIRDLAHQTHFDQLEIEALYEQFKSLATSEHGIPKSVFEQSLGPLGLEKNLITDRIFAFFDADHDGHIAFPELVAGLSVLCKGTLDEKITCAFKGYDVDGDGRISHEELHAMFKAYFHLSMELVRDVVKAMEEEMMDQFNDEENKPVSAAFTAPIPAGAANNPPTSGSGGAGGAAGANGENANGRSSGYSKGDDPDAAGGSSSGAAGAASSSSAPPASRPPTLLLVDDPGFTSGGEESVPPTPSASSSAPNSGFPRRTSSLPAGPNRRASAAVSAAAAAAAAARAMSLEYRAPAHAAASASGGPGPDRLQPIMEQMSQDAIAEMVAKTFHAIDVEGKGYIEFDAFKAYVETDPTLISWFETLGSVF